jgi:type I protein arginine methyltransferase
MDQRKADNRDANGGLAEATASRLKFDSDEEVGMEVEVTPEAEAEVIGSDNTSADYYFDSYSHFGTDCSISQKALF